MAEEPGQLLIYSEGVVIQTVTLTMPELRIGRTPDNDLSLPNERVSRKHARLSLEARGPVLTDLGSANGTFIGEEKLLPNQPRLITDGTTFRIGPFQLVYRSARPAELTISAADDSPALILPVGVPVPQPAPEPITAQITKKATAPQPSKPAPRPPVQPDSIFMRYLPDIYQENDFLGRFLRIFEDIWEPLEQRQDHIEMYFDPRTCPASFLPWLASWLDFPLNRHWPEPRQRFLLSQAKDLYNWRGTRYGLTRMIEVCAGLTPIITEDPKQPYVFRIRVGLSPESASAGIDWSFIEELVQTHKPAHAGYILEVNT